MNRNDRNGDYDEKSDDERERDSRRRRDRPSRFSGGERERSPASKRTKRSARVFVSNIPYDFRWQELKDLFREKVGEVSFVELFVDENDKPRGCGIIEFANADLAQEAVEKMHRYDLKGRKLVVKEDNDCERDKYGRIIKPGQGGNVGESGRRGGEMRQRDHVPDSVPNGAQANTYGLSKEFLDSLHIQLPLTSRVFVANLDYNVDDKKVREVFRLAGRVLHAEVARDNDGKSRGFATVEYSHDVEAVQAISMLNGQMLYDRRMSVRLDRVEKGVGRLPEGLRSIGMGLGANGAPLQDVARNLPSLVCPQPAPSAPLTPAAADLAALASTLAAANPLTAAAAAAAQLFPNAGGSMLGSAFGNSAGTLGGAGLGALGASLGGGGGAAPGRDFDSLSAALTGLSAAQDRRQQQQSHLTDSIIIKNLPVGTTWQMVRDKCRDCAGDVKYAEMRSKDSCMVQFASQWDAQRAISALDGIRVDGRPLEVRFI